MKNRRHPLACNAQVPVWHRIPSNVANCPDCLGLIKIINGYDINGSMGLEWQTYSGLGHGLLWARMLKSLRLQYWKNLGSISLYIVYELDDSFFLPKNSHLTPSGARCLILYILRRALFEDLQKNGHRIKIHNGLGLMGITRHDVQNRPPRLVASVPPILKLWKNTASYIMSS